MSNRGGNPERLPKPYFSRRSVRGVLGFRFGSDLLRQFENLRVHDELLLFSQMSFATSRPAFILSSQAPFEVPGFILSSQAPFEAPRLHFSSQAPFEAPRIHCELPGSI